MYLQCIYTDFCNHYGYSKWYSFIHVHLTFNWCHLFSVFLYMVFLQQYILCSSVCLYFIFSFWRIILKDIEFYLNNPTSSWTPLFLMKSLLSTLLLFYCLLSYGFFLLLSILPLFLKLRLTEESRKRMHVFTLGWG